MQYKASVADGPADGYSPEGIFPGQVPTGFVFRKNTGELRFVVLEKNNWVSNMTLTHTGPNMSEAVTCNLVGHP